MSDKARASKGDLIKALESQLKPTLPLADALTEIRVHPKQFKEQRPLFSKAMKYEFWYSLGGLVVGALFVLVGLILLLHGVAGSASWTAEAIGLKSQVWDAPAGVMFAIAGVIIIFITRFRVRVESPSRSLEVPGLGKLRFSSRRERMGRCP